MSKISTYNREWVVKVKDKHHFTCKVCQTNSLKVNDMGVKALKSHVKGNRIVKKVNTKEICTF